MAGPLVTALTHRAALCEGIVDFNFALVDPPHLDFQAGQFVTLAVGKDGHGQDLRRSYSIASRADQPQSLRLILRMVDGGAGSRFFADLAIGDQVAMTGPHGFFVLDPQHAGDVVFGATGTGIAPVLPMLAELTARREPGRITVYWGLRHENDLFARDEVEAACVAANAQLFIHLSQPGAGWTGARGRITPALLGAHAALHKPTFYLVGNGAMITEVKRELIARGVERKRQIRTEAFFD